MVSTIDNSSLLFDDLKDHYKKPNNSMFNVLNRRNYDEIEEYFKSNPKTVNFKFPARVNCKFLDSDHISNIPRLITPLEYAILNHDHKLLKILIENNVNLNEKFKCRIFFDRFEINCINLLFLDNFCPSFEYCLQEDIIKSDLNEMFELIIAQDNFNVNQQYIIFNIGVQKYNKYNIIQFIIYYNLHEYLNNKKAFLYISTILRDYPKIVKNDQDKMLIEYIKNNEHNNIDSIIKDILNNDDLELLLYIYNKYFKNVFTSTMVINHILYSIFHYNNIVLLQTFIDIINQINKECIIIDITKKIMKYIENMEMSEFVNVSDNLLHMLIDKKIYKIVIIDNKDMYSFRYLDTERFCYQFIKIYVIDKLQSIIMSSYEKANYELFKEFLIKYINMFIYINNTTNIKLNIKYNFTIEIINYIIINDIDKDRKFIDYIIKEFNLDIDNYDFINYIFKEKTLPIYIKHNLIKPNNVIDTYLTSLICKNDTEYLFNKEYTPIEIIKSFHFFQACYKSNINMFYKLVELNMFDSSFYKNEIFIKYLINFDFNKLLSLNNKQYINIDDIIHQITNDNIYDVLKHTISDDLIKLIVNHIIKNNIIITTINFKHINPTNVQKTNLIKNIYKIYEIGYKYENVKIMLKEFYHNIKYYGIDNVINTVNVLKYKYFMQIKNNKYYQTDEFEISFIHYIILTIRGTEIIYCMNKYPEFINDNNNKYKLYPIHCALLRNNLYLYNYICKQLHKPYIEIPYKNKKTRKNMFKIDENRPDEEKLVDDIFDGFGNNLIEFCLLNKCCMNIIRMLILNYKYDIYKYHNRENIIIKAIRVENQEFIEFLTQLGYDINFGIIRFIQSATELC